MALHSRIFKNGNSQAVRLPKEVAFPPSVREVIVHREGERIIIEPAPVRSFSDLFWKAVGQWPDFERPTQTRQDREPLFP